MEKGKIEIFRGTYSVGGVGVNGAVVTQDVNGMRMNGVKTLMNEMN